MVSDVVRSDKSDPPFFGPYTVCRGWNGLYCLKDDAGGIFQRDVPIEELKPIESAAPAANDGTERYVERTPSEAPPHEGPSRVPGLVGW